MAPTASWRRRTLVVVVGLSSVAALGAGVAIASQSSAADQVAPRTATVTAVTRDLTKTLSATGTVQFEDQRAIPFLAGPPAPVAGGAANGPSSAPAAPTSTTPSSTTTTTSPARTTPSTSVPNGQTPSSRGAPGGNQGEAPTGQAAGQATTTTTRPSTTPTTTAAAATPTTASSANNPGPAIGTQGATRHVLTWMPTLGSTVDRNQPLFRVDNQPTYLFFGVVPAHRQLDGTSTSGFDIGQLQRNLIDLGFGDGVTVNGSYDLATYSAVARWETSVGLDGDGVVQIGEIAYAPGTARITGEPVAVGSDVQSGASIVTASSITKVVATTIDARQIDAVAVGQPVDVKLPSQNVVSGKVIDVGSVATASGGTAANESSPTPATIAITIGFDGAETYDALPDNAQVAVTMRVETHQNVLAVPAAALLSGPGGQPSLTLADSGQSVAVTTGIVADGMVEITNPPPSVRDGTTFSFPA